ncbi:MAG TPA: hypothetical protein PL108_07670 [Sediminibacterium sp.]|nr:hypothetical protein [Sediminibacterium sp.]
MRNKFLFLFSLVNVLLITVGVSQTTLQVDLSDKKATSQQIELGVDDVILINKSNNFTYKTSWKRTTNPNKPFSLPFEVPASLSGSTSSSDDKLKSCSDDLKKALAAFETDDESKIKIAVQTATQLLNQLEDGDCKNALKERIRQTKESIPFPFKGILQNNQVITLEILKIGKDGQQKEKWTYTYTTEEKSRWLTHYGLTYAPNSISKVNHYHAFADTGVANKYTITKDNDDGPKPWDNISATINFTYPFHADSRPVQGGFTAGFGLNPDLQLSGHAGLSLVIGENVILGSGIAFMQKYKLKGTYKENQVIRTNLDFSALHEKVWLPEIYFTIGFRFNSNPFSKSSKDNNSNQSSNSSSGGSNSNSSTSTSSSSTNGNNTTNPTNDKPKEDTIKKKPPIDSTQPVGFVPINFDRETRSVNNEYSGLTVWNNQLLLIPQYSAKPKGVIKAINKDKFINVGKANINLADKDFTNLIFHDPEKLLTSINNNEGWEAATVDKDTIYLTIETDMGNNLCYVLKGFIKNDTINIIKKKVLLS